MEGAANVFIGIVLIFSLVSLGGLILLRRRQRGKPDSQANPWETLQPGQGEDPTQRERPGLLQRLTRRFGGRKTDEQTQPQDLGQALQDLGDLPDATPDAPPDAIPNPPTDAASVTAAVGDDEEYSEASLGDTEELTKTEAEAFRIANDAEESTDTTGAEDASPEDSTETEDGESGDEALDGSLLGAFKTDTVVETSFTRLVQRVEPVELQDLAEEIHALAALFEQESPES